MQLRYALTNSVLLLMMLSFQATAEVSTVKTSEDKQDDDPTKVTTKVGISWSDNYDFDDSNVSFSASWAFDEARKLNARVNSDASEWRVGGSWLFPIGIFNFNFGRNEFTNGASQTNYSLGTFIPLSAFGIEPAGFQIFPMAGYTYNTGDEIQCGGGKCAESEFNGDLSPENGFVNIDASGSSGYVGVFVLKPLTINIRLLSFLAGSYGSKNDEGDNYKGYFGGLGIGYSLTRHQSVKAFSFVQDNNTYIDEADKRILAAYTYQF
ncbi:hypothetical protein IB591_001254 [Salmonella enterica]|uniref:Uncharacterized protein n=4 Tax=Salmonella enterica TaxID=28901 RepID=A0A735UNN9_SALET|nr:MULTISPECIES: hypothetical protein [Enterobacteriaceae]ECT4811029.1 hypothetical protein [Salmonella enterica subsp. enterica serovar Rubislaw]ECV4715953.1 hypothetical protein [Salmonella enterica subsp. enterica serovar Java]HAE6916517.1 hypothetical protein [Salmonella enterica subsp. salamae serovar 47:b:1,5]EAB4666556.1 hypothetical protein [Salmonella enterica]EAM1282948.1 hypothetical protein [Salmonella enterica]